MKKGSRLPLPPPIDAITRLDDLEDIAEAFYLANGYIPELVSHWDPKPEFALEIERWIVREARPSSLIQYVYSSYLEIDGRVKRRLGESRDRGIILTQSGTTSIATVVTYLNNIGIKQLHIVTPAYFAVESLASSFGLQLSFPQIGRRDGLYFLPRKHQIGSRNAIWLTFPIYGTSSYVSPRQVASFIDALPLDTIVIVDESLAYPDRNSLSETKTVDRVIRIATPQKALCMNGEKVSLITLPQHLSDSFNAWSECLAGGIGASGQNALQFLASDAFDVAVTRSRQLIRSTFERMRRVLGSRSTISLDQECDGHFVMIYWPDLKMSLSDNRCFMKKILDSSGSLPIPASRNRHPDHNGFAFRVNLFRLDDAGLGGLKRLSDVLDAHV
jgi:histidinol-phosphate/aromatic aminotransferase/cobyric acid decarboxylase-like protein